MCVGALRSISSINEFKKNGREIMEGNRINILVATGAQGVAVNISRRRFGAAEQNLCALLTEMTKWAESFLFPQSE